MGKWEHAHVFAAVPRVLLETWPEWGASVCEWACVLRGLHGHMLVYGAVTHEAACKASGQVP